jgi:hypothetical protein
MGRDSEEEEQRNLKKLVYLCTYNFLDNTVVFTFYTEFSQRFRLCCSVRILGNFRILTIYTLVK